MDLEPADINKNDINTPTIHSAGKTLLERLSNQTTTTLTTAKSLELSLCDRIHPENLPPECSCREPNRFSLVIDCQKTFRSITSVAAAKTPIITSATEQELQEAASKAVVVEETSSNKNNNTIGLRIVLDPCDVGGARMTLDVTEANHDFDWTLTGIKAGEAQHFPIPGLAVVVPVMGHVGMDASVKMTGNMESLTLKVGLDACVVSAAVAAASGTADEAVYCASSVPGLHKLLPWYVLSGTYSFGDICSSNPADLVEHEGEQTEKQKFSFETALKPSVKEEDVSVEEA